MMPDIIPSHAAAPASAKMRLAARLCSATVNQPKIGMQIAATAMQQQENLFIVFKFFVFSPDRPAETISSQDWPCRETWPMRSCCLLRGSMSSRIRPRVRHCAFRFPP